MQNHVWPVVLPIAFLAYSLPLFLRVLTTTECVIDEEFHLRQGLHFCNKRFDVWDPKITTFPGLYLFALILNPLDLCSVLGLRLISLMAAAVNVVVLYKLRRRKLGGSNTAVAALDAFTFSALPPLYFFSHVYYTDALSLTTVLLMYYNWDKQAHLQAAVFGAASVLMRQTNVVWVGMLFGITALDELTKNYATTRKIRATDVTLFNLKTWLNILSSFRVVGKSIWNVLLKGSCYLIIMLPFIAFVCLNGSIVVGDKSAHKATLHLPQLFYFSIFSAFFSLTHSIWQMRAALQLLRRNLLITLFLIGAFLLIVKWNTLVHPYMLADNRHYTFYIWNRLYGRFNWFKYVMTPVYVLALALLYIALQHMRDSFKLMFWTAVVLTLCFQRLLELRYFLVPYILIRLNMRPMLQRGNKLTPWLELSYYIVLNAATFYVFFTKEIHWADFKEPQRIIW